MKKILTLIFIWLTSSCIVAFGFGFGQHPFTGTFIASSETGVMYLVLTQTTEEVSGSLTIVSPDKKEGTRSRTLTLRGNTDGNAISLNAENLTLNGRKEGNDMVLMFPNKSGTIATLTFTPGREIEFNKIVANLQEVSLAAGKAEMETNRLKNSETEKLTKLATELKNDVYEIQRNGIKDDLNNIESALKSEDYAVRQLEEDLAQLQRDASVRPMTCYQVNFKVNYDYNNNLEYTFNNKISYASNQFNAAVGQLEERLSRVEPMVKKIKQETQDLDLAVEESRFPLPKLAILLGEERSDLEHYQMLAGSARKELPNLKDKNEKALNKAKEIMRKGKMVMEKAQGMVICD